MEQKRIGLALGGGGARGMAHVGVIHVLEREGIPIDCIAGSSVGSLVGALYAAGIRGNRLIEAAGELRWRHVGQLAWPRRGFVRFARMESYIEQLAGDISFDELEIPYAAVAARVDTGRQVVLCQGRVAPAVRASCSVPGMVEPVEIDGQLLMDGGVANNLPISVVRELGADRVISVGLGSPPGSYPKGPLRAGIAAIEFLVIHAAEDPASADVHIPIPVWGLSSLIRTSSRQHLLELGRLAAEEAIPAIRSLLA